MTIQSSVTLVYFFHDKTDNQQWSKCAPVRFRHHWRFLCDNQSRSEHWTDGTGAKIPTLKEVEIRKTIGDLPHPRDRLRIPR